MSNLVTPTFTATPTITTTDPADMPVSMGTKIAGTTNTNLTGMQTWTSAAALTVATVVYSLVDAFTGTANFPTPTGAYPRPWEIWKQGHVVTLIVAGNFTQQLSSNATGALAAPVTIGTVTPAECRPAATIWVPFVVQEDGIHGAAHILTNGQFVLDGLSVMNATTSAPSTLELQATWLAP